jgi:hypothetical protein
MEVRAFAAISFQHFAPASYAASSGICGGGRRFDREVTHAPNS